MLGPCLNTVVLRSTEQPDLLAAVGAMRAETLDAFEHADAPFDQVLHRLRPERVPGRSPYTDVVLNMSLRGDRRGQLGAAELTPLYADSLWSLEAKFALTLTLVEDQGELNLVLSYQGAQVSARDAQELARTIGSLLEEMAAPRVAQYRDFLAAEQAARTSSQYEKALVYWGRRLTGAPAHLKLPAPKEPEPHGTVNLAVSAGVGAQLLQLRDEQGISPFMAASAAVAITLHRHYRCDDVVLSSPITNRNRPGLAEVFGPCLNTVALRSHIADGATVSQVLHRMREETLNAFAHSAVQFEDVVDRLNPPRKPGRTPYGDVSLAFATASSTPRSIGGRALEAVPIDAAGSAFTAKLGLTINLVHAGDRLSGHISYHGGIFSRTDVERIAAALVKVLDLVAGDVETPIDLIDLTTGEDLDGIRIWEYGGDPGPASTVPALVQVQAALRPDAPAIESKRGVLSYRRLFERAQAIAEALRPHLISAEPVVALGLERGEDFVTGMLGAWLAGAAVCPVDSAWPVARREFVLGDVHADVMLTGDEFPGLPVINPALVPAAPLTSTSTPAIAPDSVAYVIYTSGTTGKPKGVVVRHGGLANLARSCGKTLGLGEGDRCSHLLSVAFDSSQMEVWQALCHGACLVPHEGQVAATELVGWLDAKNVTITFLATALAEAVWNAGRVPRTLRWMAIGGAALSKAPPADLPYRLLNSYGPTEGTVAVSEQIVHPANGAPVNSIGRPLPGVRMFVLDSDFGRCDVGVPGEIMLAGPGIALGYLNRPELTVRQFVTVHIDDEPVRVYRTGDLGRRLPTGAVEYLGRIDRQLKIGGYRVEPGEVEDFLLRQPEVAQAVVTGQADRSPALVGYVTPAPGAHPETVELLRRARTELPSFLVPGAVIVLDTFPLTSNSKVDISALPQPTRDDVLGTAGYASPANLTEQRVAALWAAVLGVPRVGVHDNFFDLGGNSLALAKLHSRIRTTFGTDLPITILFEHTTVSAQARALRADTGSPVSQTPRRSRRAGRPRNP